MIDNINRYFSLISPNLGNIEDFLVDFPTSKM